MLSRFKYIILFFSSLLYACSFMWPQYFFSLIFCFLIPLFYYCLKNELTFFDGVMWGLIFFVTHYLAIFLVLCQRGQGIIRYVICLFLVIYFALHTGLWFYGNGLKIWQTNFFTKMVGCLFFTYAYFYWLIQYSFWPSGVGMGYCFGWPLLPCAAYPTLLSKSTYLGWQGLLLFLLLFQLLCAMALVKKKVQFFFAGCFFLIPFFSGFIQNSASDRVPPWLNACSFISPPYGSTLEQIETIVCSVASILKKKPQTSIIFMPESTFSLPLNETEFVETLYENIPDTHFSLIIGAPRTDNQMTYNSFYCIQERRITFYYDKSHLIPIVEFVPSMWKKNEKLKNIFFKNKNEYTQKEKTITTFSLNNLPIQPCICSELFYTDALTFKSRSSQTLLAIVNDSWFALKYMPKLMKLYAVALSILIQKDIIYVGHTEALWIGHNTGKTISIG